MCCVAACEHQVFWNIANDLEKAIQDRVPRYQVRYHLNELATHALHTENRLIRARCLDLLDTHDRMRQKKLTG